MIRYGTIGTNFIVDRFQEAAMENPGLHYSAVYSRNQETAGNFAAKYGVETTYTDLNAFACADDDFERGFIRASVIGYSDLEANNFDYAAVKAKGSRLRVSHGEP